MPADNQLSNALFSSELLKANAVTNVMSLSPAAKTQEVANDEILR